MLPLQRNAPAGMRCTITATLFTYGEIRSGVCGQRGSGGKALSVAAEAMPQRSAPSSSARRLTSFEVTGEASGVPRRKARDMRRRINHLERTVGQFASALRINPGMSVDQRLRIDRL